MTNLFHIYTHTCADSLILLVVLDVFSFLKPHAFSMWTLGPMIWWSVVYDGRARSHLLGNLLKPIVITKTSSIQITGKKIFFPSIMGVCWVCCHMSLKSMLPAPCCPATKLSGGVWTVPSLGRIGPGIHPALVWYAIVFYSSNSMFIHLVIYLILDLL